MGTSCICNDCIVLGCWLIDLDRVFYIPQNSKHDSQLITYGTLVVVTFNSSPAMM